jgi:hypothetical protein
MIGIGAAAARRPLPHHRAYGSVHGGSRRLRQQSSNNEGRPSDLNYALERPTLRALVSARYQGPRPLPAILAASLGLIGLIPSPSNAARRRRTVFHCRHKAHRNRHRTQLPTNRRLQLLRLTPKQNLPIPFNTHQATSMVTTSTCRLQRTAFGQRCIALRRSERLLAPASQISDRGRAQRSASRRAKEEQTMRRCTRSSIYKRVPFSNGEATRQPCSISFIRQISVLRGPH